MHGDFPTSFFFKERDICKTLAGGGFIELDATTNKILPCGENGRNYILHLCSWNSRHLDRGVREGILVELDGVWQIGLTLFTVRCCGYMKWPNCLVVASALKFRCGPRKSGAKALTGKVWGLRRALRCTLFALRTKAALLPCYLPHRVLIIPISESSARTQHCIDTVHQLDKVGKEVPSS
jgi:hypothetical protein